MPACAICGEAFEAHSGRGRPAEYCPAHRRGGIRLCPDCGQDVDQKGAHRCQPCREKAQLAYKQRQRERPSSRVKVAKRRPVRTCEQCGAEFYRPKYRLESGRFCSRECAFAHRVNSARQEERERRRAEAEERSQRIARDCTCPDCGGPKSSAAAKRCRACAVKQRKQIKRPAAPRKRPADAHGKHRARARKYGCEYEPVRKADIYERDNWTCWICGERVDLTVHSNHASYPSIDHIVDMSEKGPHTHANIRCAHRGCNTERYRRNRLLGGK